MQAGERSLMTIQSPRMPIRIEHLRLTHVRIPLCEPFVISNGAVADKDAILVELSGEGITGAGEASPMAGAFYSAQTPDSTWSVLTGPLASHLRRMATVDLGGSWADGVSGDPFAINGLDTALWDLAARQQGLALWEMLGGDRNKRVESGLAVGIYSEVPTLLARIEHHLERGGYRRVKIKVQPGWDEAPLDAVRARWPGLPLMVDANCAYRRDDIERLAAWDRFNLMMIEQPLTREDLVGHAELARRCGTPICLDESAETVEAVERAIALRSASIVNIKLQRLGTLSAAKRVHDLSRAAGIGCWMGTMPELAIGGWAAIHFATLPNLVYPTDVEASERWFVADVTEPPITCRDGLLTVPEGPGLDARLDREVIERYKVREWSTPLACRLEC